MIKVSIIIVNYNTKELLFNCITSIIEQTIKIEYEIIVVDNYSTDGTQMLIKNMFPKIHFIESKYNMGFGLANNLGVSAAKGEFLFLLNSDTILIENSIKILYDFFNTNERTLNLGVLGALLVDEDLVINGFGSHFPTCKNEINKMLCKIPLLKSFFIQTMKNDFNTKEGYFPVDYVIGADIFMKKELFEKLEGFSNYFFMYYEESDLQKRIENLGFNQYVTTATKIIHLEDGSGKSIKSYSNKKRIIVHQSKNIYLKRNDNKYFYFYVVLDLLFTFMNIFNFKYTFRENIYYIKNIYKSYNIK